MNKIYEKAQGNKKKINVYKTLKNAIQFLDLEPGAPITESELIEDLGVSRTPIREALIRLTDEQLVDVYPQRGTYVSKINVALAKEMAYMRHIVETEIFNELCTKKADVSGSVTESMFFMDQAVKNKEITEYIINDDKFHRAIFSFAGHDMIWDVISNTRTHYVRLLMLDMTLPQSLEESYIDHQKIVKFIAQGKKKELSQILETHHDYMYMKREDEIKKKYREFLLQTE
jgi:GntR family transcriptional regulator, rspAB operon transcriptional repressor